VNSNYHKLDKLQWAKVVRARLFLEWEMINESEYLEILLDTVEPYIYKGIDK